MTPKQKRIKKAQRRQFIKKVVPYFTTAIFIIILIGLIGLMVFLFAFKYSHGIFSWVENQTFGTRSYILEKFECP